MRPAPGPGDVNRDGQVDVQDFLQIILGWGVCSADLPCPADLDGDGTVGVPDLVAVLVNWG